MDKLDGRSNFVVDDSTTLDDATMPLIDLLGNESANLNIINSTESNSNTHALANDFHEEINLQNNWVSTSPISRNQESDQLQELRNEANQSQLVYSINSNNQHQQNFNIPSSSSTMNSLASPSRKRKLFDFSSKSSANGSSSCVIANTNPKNTVNQFNSLLGFNNATSVGNAEISQRNCRIRINPLTSSSATPPIQWTPTSNNMQANTRMPISQPLTAGLPLIQNVHPFSVNVASNSRTSNYFTRFDARRSMENMRSNIQEGNGHSNFSPNSHVHNQQVPQGVNNNGADRQIALLQAMVDARRSTMENMRSNTQEGNDHSSFSSNSHVHNQQVPEDVYIGTDTQIALLQAEIDARRSTMENMRSNIQEGNGHSSLSPNSHVHDQQVPQGVNNNGADRHIALLQTMVNVERYNGSKLRYAIVCVVDQLSKKNFAVEQVIREGRRKILLESIHSFVHAKYHRRVVSLQGMHKDMLLDGYNVSFEELLAIGERIGSAITEENINKCLRQQKYISPMEGVTNEGETCCICQEEYGQEENMVRLDCGHDFHVNCITKWLMWKNSCPICRTIGPITEIAC